LEECFDLIGFKGTWGFAGLVCSHEKSELETV